MSASSVGAGKHNYPPNETTPPILKARGPRRAALGSGPWGQPCAFQRFRLSAVTPSSWSRVLGTPTCITDPNSRSIQLAKSMNDNLERDCRPDPCEQTSADCID